MKFVWNLLHFLPVKFAFKMLSVKDLFIDVYFKLKNFMMILSLIKS